MSLSKTHDYLTSEITSSTDTAQIKTMMGLTCKTDFYPTADIAYFESTGLTAKMSTYSTGSV